MEGGRGGGEGGEREEEEREEREGGMKRERDRQTERQITYNTIILY